MEPGVMNLGLCAERTALFSALAQGEKELKLSRCMLELSSLVILVAAVDRCFQIWRRMFCGS